MNVFTSLSKAGRRSLLTPKSVRFGLQMSSAIPSPSIPEVAFMETEDALEIVPAGSIGDKAVAKQPLQAGTLINEFFSPVIGHPTMHTVQLSETVHVAPTKGAEFISHACANTNTRIIVDTDNLVGRFFVTKDVEKGEELSFNYNTTEWDMSSPFECLCPSCQANGSRKVQGFKHLSLADRMAIIQETSPLIRAKANEECLEHLQQLYSMEKDGSYYDIGNNC